MGLGTDFEGRVERLRGCGKGGRGDGIARAIFIAPAHLFPRSGCLGSIKLYVRL